jgi:hypothetical protein
LLINGRTHKYQSHKARIAQFFHKPIHYIFKGGTENGNKIEGNRTGSHPKTT